MVKSKILSYKFTYLSMVKNIWTHSKNIEHSQKYLNMVKKYLAMFKKQGTSGLPEVTDNILSLIQLHHLEISSAASYQ